MSILVFTMFLFTGGNMEQRIKEINPYLSNRETAEITQSILRLSIAYQLEPKLVAAVVATESRFRPKAVGKTHGEIGLMQLRHQFHATFIPNTETRKKYLFVVDHNLVYGIRYLSSLKTLFGGRYNNYRWLEFYNRGPAAHPRSFKYTKKVLAFYKIFGGTVSEQHLSSTVDSGPKRRKTAVRQPAKSGQAHIGL